ncbi:uncharacterized protein LOC135224014 [Macrobrachium nipponense]|uniref:uncharacterized protein LOC135224014 n=1 Tax=Macrobrachium nipponense TaxID=159736 RepID=UPI0030C8345F
MDPDTFYKLLAKVQYRIEKQDTNMRDSISALARLEATLLFLSTGASYSSLQYSTRISKQSLSQIVPDTCQAIYDELKDEYLQTPSTPEKWKSVADGFNTRWNFPNCLGSIDGKHIAITARAGSGSYYYNYKGNYTGSWLIGHM